MKLQALRDSLVSFLLQLCDKTTLKVRFLHLGFWSE